MSDFLEEQQEGGHSKWSNRVKERTERLQKMRKGKLAAHPNGPGSLREKWQALRGFFEQKHNLSRTETGKWGFPVFIC